MRKQTRAQRLWAIPYLVLFYVVALVVIVLAVNWYHHLT